MSICPPALSVFYLSIYLFDRPSVCLPVSPVFLSVFFLSLCLFPDLSVSFSSVCLSVYLSLFLFLDLSACLCVCPSFCMSVPLRMLLVPLRLLLPPELPLRCLATSRIVAVAPCLRRWLILLLFVSSGNTRVPAQRRVRKVRSLADCPSLRLSSVHLHYLSSSSPVLYTLLKNTFPYHLSVCFSLRMSDGLSLCLFLDLDLSACFSMRIYVLRMSVFLYVCAPAPPCPTTPVH